LRIHIIANIHRKDALSAAADARNWLQSANHEVFLEAETARSLKLEGVRETGFGSADLIISLGGDGTLIRAAHLCADTATPILGVYFGRLGFVTQATLDGLKSAVEEFAAGRARIEPRLMLQAELIRGERTVATLHALNEITLQRDVTARMMTFRVWIDDHLLTSYPADGVLVATPTGSTAYNLSAGGPILDPNVQALVLTAIAPHTLSSRPLVVRPESVIRLRVTSHGDAVLSADAHTRLHILAQDEVRVTKSTRVTNLVTVDQSDFLVKLGRRLLWSKGMLGEHD